MTVIGLTGGIASGKSTAAGWMKELGAVVIDADRLGHRVYEPGTSGFQAVVNEFGHDLVQADGTINRQLLGGRVFGDPEQMKRLTDIVWPEIRRLAKQEVTELKRRDRNTPIVLEAAVLVEANWFDLVDEVWVVTVEPAIARSRLMGRNGLTEAQAQARIDSQISNKERAQLAYVKIDNSGTLDEFHQAVDREWKKLARRAGFAVATPAAPAAGAAPAKRVASKASTSRVASKPAAATAAPAKTAATASKAAAAKAAPARAAVAKSSPAARGTVKAAPVKSAPAKASPAKASAATPKTKAVPVKASPVRAGATKAAPARATATRSASTQSASTRTTSARPAAARPAAARPVARASAPRAAAAPAARTASRATATAVKRTTVKPAATRSSATKAAARPVARPAARPVAGRRAGTK